MSITVILPNALRPHAAGNDRIALDARTAGEALQKLIQRYPALEGHLPEVAGPGGQAIYRNGALLQKLDGLETALSSGDRLTLIVPEGEL